jgi:hypothetical protein
VFDLVESLETCSNVKELVESLMPADSGS